MKWDDVKVFRLEGMFKAKFHDHLSADSDLWLDYCDRHKIIQMSPAEVQHLFNKRGYICLDNPEFDNQFLWILVSKKFAERALMLGGLP